MGLLDAYTRFDGRICHLAAQNRRRCQCRSGLFRFDYLRFVV